MSIVSVVEAEAKPPTPIHSGVLVFNNHITTSTVYGIITDGTDRKFSVVYLSNGHTVPYGDKWFVVDPRTDITLRNEQ